MLPIEEKCTYLFHKLVLISVLYVALTTNNKARDDEILDIWAKKSR